MARPCSFLRLPNDCIDAAARGFDRVNNVKYLFLDSNIFQSLFWKSSFIRKEKQEIINSVVTVLNKIETIGRLVVELGEDPLDPALMEAFLRVLRTAQIREVHVVEHTNSDFFDTEETSYASQSSCQNSILELAIPALLPQHERDLQLVQLGASMRENSSIQKVCIMEGRMILSSLGPSQTLIELDVSLANGYLTRSLIEMLPRMTGLKKLVLQTNEIVGLPPGAKEWKAELMDAIQKSLSLKEVTTDDRVPLLDGNDLVKIEGWIQRNEQVSRWRGGHCRPAQASLLPNIAASVQCLSASKDIVFDLLVGEAACHQHLLVPNHDRSRKRQEPAKEGLGCLAKKRRISP